MSRLMWLDGYSGQTTDELIALEGEYRTDSLAVAFEQAVLEKVDPLTDEERVILAVEALEREVNNGGYDQFFRNSSKEYAPILVSALNRIGRTAVAHLTQQAINTLAIEGPLTVDAIDRVMEVDDDNRDERLGECDDRYYEVAGDLADPLLEFIKDNRESIILSRE